MTLGNNKIATGFVSQLDRLSDIRSKVALLAAEINLSNSECFRLIDETSRQMINTYPGEHYRWLAAYVISQRPSRVIELGTKNGLSLLSMFAAAKYMNDKDYSPQFVSIDISNVFARRHFFPEEVINADNVTIATGDATLEETYSDIGFSLQDCDFIFLDTAHTGRQEAEILNTLYKLGLKDRSIVLADDIFLNQEMRVWWESLAMPKVQCDAHFSGSGLISFLGASSVLPPKVSSQDDAISARYILKVLTSYARTKLAKHRKIFARLLKMGGN